MRRIPLPFLLALGGGGVASLAMAFARAAMRRDPGDLYSTGASVVTALTQGLAIAAAALVRGGALGLRRHLPERPTGILAVGAILLLAAAIARPICEALMFDRLHSYLAVLDGRRWLGRVDATGAVAFAAGLVFLGEHAERVRNLTVPLIALALAAHPPLAIADELAHGLHDMPGTSGVWIAAAGSGTIQLGFAALSLAALAAAVSQPAPE